MTRVSWGCFEGERLWLASRHVSGRASRCPGRGVTQLLQASLDICALISSHCLCFFFFTRQICFSQEGIAVFYTFFFLCICYFHCFLNLKPLGNLVKYENQPILLILKQRVNLDRRWKKRSMLIYLSMKNESTLIIKL